ncbi:hypothetical protein PSA5_00820 [Pseudomonas syringae pv. actinidiae]|nr:hypothetical protein PSA5_00820 [Pseudomonas syringae pv. actinidiae]
MAEMHFPRLLVLRVDAVHAYRRLETHADVEEVHVELTVDVFPQRMIRVVANGIELQRRHVRQDGWQHLLVAHIAFACELLGMGLQLCKIEVFDLAIGCCGQCSRSIKT